MEKFFIEFNRACNLETIHNLPFLQEKHPVEFYSGPSLLNPQFFTMTGFVRFVPQTFIELNCIFKMEENKKQE